MGERVKGRAALVTGAGRGIGRAVALTLAREGADVLVNEKEERALEKVYQELKEEARGGKVARFAADVSDEKQVNAMMDYLLAEFGKINIVVNNAASCPLKWFREMNTSASMIACPIFASLTYSPPSTGTSSSSVPFRPSAMITWHPVEKGENPLV